MHIGWRKMAIFLVNWTSIKKIVAVYSGRGFHLSKELRTECWILDSIDEEMPMKKSKANKCKCCNSVLGAVASHLIFDDAGKQQNIAFLLFDYIGRRVIESDGDRAAVCDNCLKQLVQCYEFKQKCVQANEVDSEDEDENDGNDLDSNENSEEESGSAEVIVAPNEPMPGTSEDEFEFHRYLDIIEECDDDDDVNADDSDGATGVDERTTAESEQELLDDLCEFVLTKDYDVADEQRSPIGADIEFLDVEIENEADYEYADIADDVEPESEVIELAEFALDTTSKTAKTIGKFISHFNCSFFSLDIISTWFTFRTDTVEDLHRIKEKLKEGVPRHMIELNRTMKSTAQSLDVEKIVTSDDLINILEADYQSENNYSRRVRDDADVFKIPKIEPCEEIEYLEDEDSQVCIDEYLKSIAYIDYVENYGSGFYCKVSNSVETYP